MNTAIVFSLLTSNFVKPVDEAVASARSVSKVALPDGCSKWLAYDPKCTGADIVGKVSAELPGFEPVEVPPVSVSLQCWGCRQMDFAEAAIARSGCDSIMSFPSNWLCLQPMNLDLAFRITMLDDILSVFLGGCPTAHVDSGSVFSWDDGPVPKYVRLRVRSFDFTGLDRMECPCVVNARLFKDLLATKGRRLNDLNRCGWDPKYQVLYPDALTHEPGDGKPEPFRDIVGICPEYWDKYELKEDGDGQV